MTRELTDAQKAKMGILSNAGFKTLRVDNGDDKNGTNATGEWVIKSKNAEGGYDRQQHGKEIKGVVLAARAKIFSKYNPAPGAVNWYSDEFNSADTSEVFNIYAGHDKSILHTGTYAEIKAKFTQSDGLGNSTKLFSYRTYVYFFDGVETLKLELTGQTQGSWFDYKLPESKLLRVLTICTIVQVEDDKGNVSFMSQFKDGDSADDMFDASVTALDDVPETRGSKGIEAPKAQPAIAPVQEATCDPAPPQSELSATDAEVEVDPLADILADKGMA